MDELKDDVFMNLKDYIQKKFEYVFVRITSDVPKFVGIDLVEYGPFKKGDVVKLPKENANLLLKNGYATQNIEEEKKELFFTFSKTYKIDYLVTENVKKVCEVFGIGLKQKEFPVFKAFFLKFKKGDIIYITGSSGGGKTTLLKAMKSFLIEKGFKVVDFKEVDFRKDIPLIDVLMERGMSFKDALYYLNVSGLSEAYLYIRKFDELSDGQKYRFKLAYALSLNPEFIICDEFLTNLDRIQARVIAFTIQKFLRKKSIGGIFASTHLDIIEDLQPDFVIYKEFGSDVRVSLYNERRKSVSFYDKLEFQKGSISDYKKLEFFHYKGSVSQYNEIYKCVLGDKLVGVIVIGHPTNLSLTPRNKVLKYLGLPYNDYSWVNENFRQILRVVVKPEFRSIGIGSFLVRKYLEVTNATFVEILAAMLKYSRFADKAGMVRIHFRSYRDEKYERIMTEFKRKFNLSEKDFLDVDLIKKVYKELKGEKRKEFERLLLELRRRYSYIRGIDKHKNFDVKKILENVDSLVRTDYAYLIWMNPRKTEFQKYYERFKYFLEKKEVWL